MKISILRVSIAAAVVLCATGLLAKEPQSNSGGGDGRSEARGKAPDKARTQGPSNIGAPGKVNPQSRPTNLNPQGNGNPSDSRQRTDAGGREDWRYRQNDNRWWYWTADNHWLYWENNRWVSGASDTNQDAVDPRYRWYNGRWWYLTTDNRWLYWDDNQWVTSN